MSIDDQINQRRLSDEEAQWEIKKILGEIVQVKTLPKLKDRKCTEIEKGEWSVNSQDFRYFHRSCFESIEETRAVPPYQFFG